MPNASLQLHYRKEHARTEMSLKKYLGSRMVIPLTENTHHWDLVWEARKFS